MKSFKYLIQLYKNIPFKNKLILAFSVQIIIPIIFIAFIFNQSTNIIRDDATSYSQNVLKMASLRLNDFGKNLDKLALAMSYDDKIRTLLKMKPEQYDSFEYYLASKDVINYFINLMFSRDEIQSTAIISNNKQYCVYDGGVDANIKDLFPYDKVIPKLNNSQGKAIWFLDRKGNNIQNIYLVREIYDTATYGDKIGRIGVAVFLIKKSYFESVFNDLYRSTMNVFIVSADKLKIVGGKRSKVDLLKSIKNNKLNNKKECYIDKKLKMLVSYKKVNPMGWKIVDFTPLNELYKKMNEYEKWFYIMIFCELIFLSFISIFMAKDIVNPINKLVLAMRRVEAGGKREQVLVERKDEIGFLSKSFNDMSAQIDNLIHGMYLEKITRREAQIKALQAQINPHFLFNTLESVNWLAQLNDVPEISDMVTALCNLMDAGVGRDDKLITIEQELEYIFNYITIIKYRYGERLTVKQNIDKELLNIQIPRLLLQPLVENATCYSLDKTRKNIIIEINGYINEECAFVEIIDNGIGIKAKQLMDLNKKFEMDENTKGIKEKASKSVGTENVNRRVKLFFGEEFGLKIESEFGEYTKVIVKLPKCNAKDGGSYYV